MAKYMSLHLSWPWEPNPLFGFFIIALRGNSVMEIQSRVSPHLLSCTCVSSGGNLLLFGDFQGKSREHVPILEFLNLSGTLTELWPMTFNDLSALSSSLPCWGRLNVKGQPGIWTCHLSRSQKAARKKVMKWLGSASGGGYMQMLIRRCFGLLHSSQIAAPVI